MSSILSKTTIEHYKDYYNHLLFRHGVKKSTASTHITCIKQFFDQYPELTCSNLESFVVSLKEQGRKHSYINNLIAGCKAYTRYLQLSGKQFDPDVLKVKKLKEGECHKATMSDDEIEAFLSFAPPKKRGFNKKNYDVWTLFFSILAYTGMRPREVANLTVDDVDFGRNIFVVRESKTTPRNVPIPPNIKSSILNHLQNCESLLFPSKQGGYDGKVSDVQWGYNFHKRIRALGIRRSGLTVYSLRHSFITAMLEEDVNIFKVQKIVGHRRIDTTARYTHMTTKDIQRAILNHPTVRKQAKPEEVVYRFKQIVASFGFQQNPTIKFKMNEGNNDLLISLTW